MFCVNCGTSLKEGWKFCYNCGYEVVRMKNNIDDGFSEVKKDTFENYKISETEKFPILFNEEEVEVVNYPCSTTFDKYFKVIQKKHSKYNAVTKKIEILVSDSEEEYSVEDKLYDSFDIINKETGKIFNGLAGLRAYKVVENGIYFVRNDTFYFLSITGEQKTIDLVENVISMIYNSILNNFDFVVYRGNTQIGWHECRESCGGNFEEYYDIYSIQTGIKVVKNIIL